MNEPVRTSRIVSEFDPVKFQQAKKIQMLNKTAEFTFASELAEFQLFLSSAFWTEIPKTPLAHNLLFSNMEETFRGRRKFVYDDGRVTHGSQELWDSLSKRQKQFIVEIEESKTPGFFSYNNIVVTYTGSTVAIEQPPQDPSQTWREEPPR
jgi:hypothetical protein